MSYEYERVVTPRGGLRLHLNENTRGCSPHVVEALQRLTRTDAAFYPDYEAVTAAVCAHLGVAPDEVVLTNGLDEGILGAAVVAGRDRTSGIPEAIVVVPAFDMYAACADATGARVVEVPAGPDYEFPLEGVLAALTPATRIVFLTSPNNPTGGRIEPDAVYAIADAAPGALIFLDEAYADFAGTTAVGTPDLKAHGNVVVGRTFAKAYGLAALRAGAVIGAPAALAPIRRAIPPYSLNVCAAAALSAALEDGDYYNWYLEQVRMSRELLYDALARLGVRYWRSAANFVLADFGRSASRVVEGLAAREVFVRDRSKDPACPGCVRITAGVVEHTRACITALEEVLCGAAR
jgi:histidinol-phosphate aminotransferase